MMQQAVHDGERQVRHLPEAEQSEAQPTTEATTRPHPHPAVTGHPLSLLRERPPDRTVQRGPFSALARSILKRDERLVEHWVIAQSLEERAQGQFSHKLLHVLERSSENPPSHRKPGAGPEHQQPLQARLLAEEGFLAIHLV